MALGKKNITQPGAFRLLSSNRFVKDAHRERMRRRKEEKGKERRTKKDLNKKIKKEKNVYEA
jgi:hypothetical protein